ncbi:MAG: helix-hairpin-helix domain-containing protein, partial [Chitinophagaceae bacterium]
RQLGTFKNELDDIMGIGKGTSDLLLKTFKSIKNIKSATLEELEKLIGAHKAKIIITHFQANTNIENQ